MRTRTQFACCLAVLTCFAIASSNSVAVLTGSEPRGGQSLREHLVACERIERQQIADPRDAFKCDLISGYINGWFDAQADEEPRFFCAPGPVSLGQLKAVVLKWVSDHPEEWNLHWSSILLHTFIDAFPCKKK